MKKNITKKSYKLFFFTTLFVYTALPMLAQEPIILQHKTKINIIELQNLNSPLQETNLSISPNGNFLFFMSDRGQQPWSLEYGTYNGQKRYDGDIWFSEKKDFTWQKPICLGPNVNTANGEDEPNVSPDGQFVIFQSWKFNWMQNGPYYQAEHFGNKWKVTNGLGGGITQFFIQKSNKYRAFATDGAAVSPDGKTFLVACGQFYKGNMDLYISRKEAGEWQNMQKLNISTNGNERSVFIAADGKTIYFATDHYKTGFGGLDIYKATLDTNNYCTDIQNIGKPFNTAKDDYGFIINAKGTEAYFVRDGDIFYADIANANKKIKPLRIYEISGTITDFNDNFVETYVQLCRKDSVIAISKTNVINKKFFFVINKKYNQLTIRSVNNTFKDTTFEIFKNTFINIKQKQEIKNTLSNTIVYFNFNKFHLTDNEKNKILNSIKIVEKASEYTIKIKGYTDSKGKGNYNKKLSEKRAETVYKILISNGIKAENIEKKCFGEQYPVKNNNTEKGASLNRRVEMEIEILNNN